MTAAAARVGVVADDLTGATDLAEQVWRAGGGVTLVVGVPDAGAPDPGSDWVVVALKNRSSPAADAVAEVTRSAAVLRGWGVPMLYQKYCSTFDSTPAGNIGPIGDALAAPAGEGVLSIGTPATPSVGRTVRDGRLSVHGVPLEETSMAQHPLTPMTDSDLGRLLRPQTIRPVHRFDPDDAAPPAGWLIADATADAELDRVAHAVRRLSATVPVVAHGGAGLAAAMARSMPPTRRPGEEHAPDDGRRLVLSGSLSAATQAQHEAFAGPVIRLDPGAAAETELARFVAGLRRLDGDATALVTSAPAPGQSRGGDPGWFEAVLASTARVAVEELGVTRLLVAGGETSGAVIGALGVRTLHLFRSVAPGLAWCTADRGGATIGLLLKSGNFGEPGLFHDAFEVLP